MLNWDDDGGGFNNATPASFVSGDHLRSPRLGYTHHGIYIGDGCVIHYAGFAREMAAGAVAIATLEEFANGGRVEVVPHPHRKHGREASVSRAYRRLGEDWYNLVINNCEHFVHWCIEGAHDSPQVNRVARSMISTAALEYLKRSPALRQVVLTKLRDYGLFADVANTVLNGAASDVLAGVASRTVVNAVGERALGAVVAKAVASTAVCTVGGGSVTTAAVGLVGTGALASISTVALPALAAVGVGLGLKYLWDEWLD